MSEETYADRVAGQVRYEVARRRLRTRDLAERLGMTYSAFNERYQGRRAWRLNEIQTMASAIGVPLARLLLVDDTGVVATAPPVPDLSRLEDLAGRLAAQVTTAQRLLEQVEAEIVRLGKS